MNTVAKRVRKDGLHRMLCTVLTADWASKVMLALDPLYTMVESDFDLKPADQLPKYFEERFKKVIDDADLPIKFISVKSFPPNDDEEKGQKLLKRLGLWEMSEVTTIPTNLTVGQHDTLQDILQRGVMGKFSRVTARKYPFLDEYNYQEGSPDILGMLSFVTANRLIDECVHAALANDEGKLKDVAEVFELFPDAWVWGTNKSRTHIIVLCG